jgi:hypothetical protein
MSWGVDIQAALVDAVMSSYGDASAEQLAANILPIVRDIAAREAARELEAAAEQIAEARDVCPNAERRQGYGGSLVVLRARARALGLDPTHGKATT